MKISLTVMSAGKAAGKELPILVPQFLIGRDPQCNLRPASSMISKRHCAILVKNNEVFLHDFDSTNGTFLNDQPIKGEVPLKNGDVLKVGALSFKVVIDATAPAPKRPTPPPKPRTADIMDDDAAAALLSLDDDEGVNISTTETAEDKVPGGSTIMDVPAFTTVDTSKESAEKADDKKAQNKAKPATGAAQDAAKAILDKIRAGKRK
jgi:pSer/pThr/pTyr-binding forkhead associated (FHA) protein